MPKTARPPIERMISRRVIDGDGCWVWPGTVNGSAAKQPNGMVGGYGEIRDAPAGKTLMVHRVSYEHYIGPIPVGMVVDHLCHTEDSNCPGNRCKHRRCWNPDHLRLRTRAQNSIDGTSPNMRTFREGVCRRGHPMTSGNVAESVRKSGTTRRQCKTCQRLWRVSQRKVS